MSLQLYQPVQKVEEGALVVLPNGQQITEAQYDKRLKDAEELGEKLKYITENVPTRIMNTSGSNAGAGSGEFHMYRMARRREMMRLSRIDEQAKEAELQAEHEERQKRLRDEEEQRTAKRRAKRQKRKVKKKGRQEEGGAAPVQQQDMSDSEEDVPQAELD